MRLFYSLIWFVFDVTSSAFQDDPNPPPKRLLEPIKTFSNHLIAGGPTNSYPASQSAFGYSQMAMFDNGTLEIMEDIKDGLRYLFQTTNQYTLALAGTGSTAMYTVLDNLLEPGDVIFIPSNGYWAQRVSDWATRFGATVKNINNSLGVSFTINEIEEGIKLHKPNVVYLTHGESSTGAYQNIEGIGELCQKYNCLVAVDAVSSLNIIPFYFDKWKIDAAFSNTQKGLGGPVGLAPISFSPRAIAKILNRKTKVISYIHDVKNWIETNYWNIDPNRTQTALHSFPVLLYYTLRESLAIAAVETLEKIWSKYVNVTSRFYEAVKELKLQYYVSDPKDRLTGVIAFHPPNNFTAEEFANYIQEKHNLEIGTGIGPTHGKIIRVAFLGANANPNTVDLAISAFKDGLEYFAARKALKG